MGYHMSAFLLGYILDLLIEIPEHSLSNSLDWKIDSQVG